MRIRSVLLSLGVAGAVSTAVIAASAQEQAAQAKRAVSDFPFFVGVTGGAGYATLQHPEIAKQIAGVGGVPVSFGVATIGLHAGYTFNDHVNAGIEFGAMETGISRNNAGETFKLGYSTQAACTNCHPPLSGADLLATTIVLSTFGARVEYTPLGRDGLFVGASVGLATIVGYSERQGAGFAGRLGYRFRPTNIMTVSLEAGMQGQVYGDASLYMPYGAAVLRPYF